MASGQTLILSTRAARMRGHALLDAAPEGCVLNIRLPTRTNKQNDKMQVMLSDISRAKPQGRNLPTEVWKVLFMDELGYKPRWEPSLDGNGVVNAGYRSSRLTVAEMSDLITAIQAFGDEHGVDWTDPELRKVVTEHG